MYFSKISSVVIGMIIFLGVTAEAFEFGNRIVGGMKADISLLPYQVALFGNGEFGCGGSIITPTCILTAAHCLDEWDPATVTVRGGISQLDSKDGITRRVINAFIPDEYRKTTKNMDVAILKLDKEMSGPNSKPIALNDKPLIEGLTVRVSGWGLTDEISIGPSNDLRMVNVQLIGKKRCSELYKRKEKLTRTMFCAIGGSGTKDACSGDSGGPVVVKGKQVGIVSVGLGCAHAEFPGIYTSVKLVLPWINSTVKSFC